LCHLDDLLKESLLVEYLPTRTKWASTPNDPPTLNGTTTTEEDEWVPRFVTLTPTDIACYLHATDLHPQITLPVASIASAGTLHMAPAAPAVAKETSSAVAAAGGAAVEAPSSSSSEEWLAFHVTTSYGFKLECATRSCAKVRLVAF
ncbi:unnamed protein product, partial [Closterium sp. NIES-53]